MPRLQMTQTNLGNNYRITIPRKIVEEMGWKKGDNIKVEAREEYLVLHRTS